MKTPICEMLGCDFPLLAFSHCMDVVAAAFCHPVKLVANALGLPTPFMLERARREGVPVASLTEAIAPYGESPILGAGGIAAGRPCRCRCSSLSARRRYERSRSSPRPVIPAQGN